MKTILFASACLILVSGPALACRGTTEFPQALEQLNQSKVPAERMKELLDQLSQGQAMHGEGHRQGDMGKMGQSLRILDSIKPEIGM